MVFEVQDELRITAYGSVHEYQEKFKSILKRYLTMKYQQKKEGRDSLKRG